MAREEGTPESIDTAVDRAVDAFRGYAAAKATPAEVVAQADGFNRLKNLPGPTQGTRIVSRIRGPNWTAVITFEGIRIELPAGVVIPTAQVSEQVAALGVDGKTMAWPREVQRTGELMEYLQAVRTYAAGAAENPDDGWAADFLQRTILQRNAALHLPAPPPDWRTYRPDNVFRGCGWQVSIVGPFVIYEVVPVV